MINLTTLLKRSLFLILCYLSPFAENISFHFLMILCHASYYITALLNIMTLIWCHSVSVDVQCLVTRLKLPSSLLNTMVVAGP